MTAREVSKFFGGRVFSLGRFPELAELLGRIDAAYAPLAVVLYGSRARGDATASSDWDLKVIVPDDAPNDFLSPMFGWKVQEGSGVYGDVSCIRLSEFVSDLSVANSAASHLVREGIVLEPISVKPDVQR
ncbi:nucleotidyltransferase domain-containing protein [Sinorhizobium meliloti]|uniref:nucleotidyltransferase domain-containing protein n=1 Tax=Rhizobium meliloti TaxID=382 RepID=UPI003D655FFB